MFSRGLLLLVGFWVFLGVCLGVAPLRGPIEKPLSEQEIQSLIRQLGADSATLRNQAMRQLLEHEEAEDALRQARKAPDLEVALRARKILRAFSEREQQRALVRFKNWSRQGVADLVAEQVVAWSGADDDHACWQSVLDIGHVLVAWEKKSFKRCSHKLDTFPDHRAADYFRRHRPLVLPRGDPLTARPTFQPGDLNDRPFIARGREIKAEGHAFCGLFTSTEKAVFDDLRYSVLLSGGEVSLKDQGHLVVACAGDFASSYRIWLSMVVSGGTIHCPQRITNSVLIANGDIIIPERASVRMSALRAKGKIIVGQKSVITDTTMEENLTDLKCPVRFFQLADVGLAVEGGKSALRVTRVDAGKPFASAGLQVGDLLASVDGQAVATPDAFRRLIRRHVALEKVAKVGFRRNQVEHSVPVSFRP